MLAPAFGSYFTVSFTKQRIESAYINFHLILTGVIHIAELVAVPEYPFGLPWFDAVFELFRKCVGIRSYPVSFISKNGRCWMLPVPGPVVGWKPRDDHIGLKLSDYPYYVRQHLVFDPEFQRLFSAFAIPKIKGTGKELLCTVEPSGSQQFLRSYQTKLNTLFIAYQVLPAISTCNREIARSDEILIW